MAPIEDNTDPSNAAASHYILATTLVADKIISPARPWDSANPVDYGRLFQLVRAHHTLVEAYTRVTLADATLFEPQRRKIGDVLVEMLRYKPGHQEIFEPYAVRIPTLRVAYEDRIHAELAALCVFDLAGDEATREHLLRFAAEKGRKPDELLAKLTNTQHNIEIERRARGEVDGAEWEKGVLATSRALVAMKAVQDHLYSLLTPFEIRTALLATVAGREILEKVADACLKVVAAFEKGQASPGNVAESCAKVIEAFENGHAGIGNVAVNETGEVKREGNK